MRNGNGNRTSYRLLFAGNLGAFQGVERIIEVAELLRDHREFEFYFVGGGERQQQLIERAGGLVGDTVHFLGPQPYEKTICWMSQVDLGIVSLTRGVYRVAYPSKVMAYLATGLPVLAMVESTSELATTIREHHIGYVPADTTPRSVVKAILYARSDALSGSGPTRTHVRSVGDQLFHPERTLNRWAQLMKSLEAAKWKNADFTVPGIHSFAK